MAANSIQILNASNSPHQVSISSTFFARLFCTKVLFCQKVSREKLLEALSYEKCSRKTLIKLMADGYFLSQMYCLQNKCKKDADCSKLNDPKLKHIPGRCEKKKCNYEFSSKQDKPTSSHTSNDTSANYF
jgi:hypothetical protein